MHNLERFRTPLGLEHNTNVLFVFAHPDDESMTGGLMEAAAVRGVTPHAFYATDGEKSTYGDAAVLRAYGRRQEAAHALAVYGVSHMYFAGLPDGGLLDNHVDETRDKILDVLERRPFSAIVSLGENGFDGHTDHRAAHLAAYAAAQTYAITAPDFRFVALSRGDGKYHVPADPDTKLRALSRHETQFDISVLHKRNQLSGALEVSGFSMSEDTERRLAPYWLNHRLEVYTELTLHSGELALAGAAAEAGRL